MKNAGAPTESRRQCSRPVVEDSRSGGSPGEGAVSPGAVLDVVSLEVPGLDRLELDAFAALLGLGFASASPASAFARAAAAILLGLIVQAAEGKAVPTTEWAAALESDRQFRSANLTPREREVLALYASGLGVRAVGSALFILENTVEDHLRRIRREYSLLGRDAGTKVELYRRGLEATTSRNS